MTWFGFVLVSFFVLCELTTVTLGLKRGLFGLYAALVVAVAYTALIYLTIAVGTNA